jgi:c(7)-type cytochrome triheme protein
MSAQRANFKATGISRMRILRLVQWAFVVVAIGLFGYSFTAARADTSEHANVTLTESETPSENPPSDYSRFTHYNQFHSRLPCLICHTRTSNSPRIGFPGGSGHLPCAGCHGLQFSDQSSPICTICHTNPQTGAMKRFPGLRSFGARFNHAKHLRTSCMTCHAPARGGVAKSIPSGASAHTTCFQCHTANSSNTMASCSTCHQPGRLVRTPEWAKSFRFRFSHAKHAGQKMSCAACHTVRAGSARGQQVSAPTPSMHFAPARSMSCGGCHNGKRAIGPDDFSNCKRCHVGNTFKF